MKHSSPFARKKHLLALLLVASTLSGCAAQHHSRTENAVGGVLAGAAAGGAIGTLCCADPVHGLPAGLLIGGIVGGVSGLLWPRVDDDEPVAPPPRGWQ